MMRIERARTTDMKATCGFQPFRSRLRRDCARQSSCAAHTAADIFEELRLLAIECGVQSRLRISVGPHRAGLATAGDVKRVVGTPLPPADCDDSRVLLRVPLRICIALGVPGVCLEAACADDLKALLESDTAWEVKLASVMLWVANSADSPEWLRSIWRRYLSKLPGSGSLISGITMTDRELQLTQDTTLASACRQWRAEVVDVYDAYLNGVAEAWCSGAEDLIWATSLVESRAFEGPPGPLGRVQLVIPFVDMANHCEAPNAHQRMATVLPLDEMAGMDAESLDVTVWDSYMEVVMDQEIGPDEEVRISYGSVTSRASMEQYGFYMPGSRHERAVCPTEALRQSGLESARVSRSFVRSQLAGPSDSQAAGPCWERVVDGMGGSADGSGGDTLLRGRLESVRGSLVEQFGWAGMKEYRASGACGTQATLFYTLSSWALQQLHEIVAGLEDVMPGRRRAGTSGNDQDMLTYGVQGIRGLEWHAATAETRKMLHRGALCVSTVRDAVDRGEERPGSMTAAGYALERAHLFAVYALVTMALAQALESVGTEVDDGEVAT